MDGTATNHNGDVIAADSPGGGAVLLLSLAILFGVIALLAQSPGAGAVAALWLVWSIIGFLTRVPAARFRLVGDQLVFEKPVQKSLAARELEAIAVIGRASGGRMVLRLLYLQHEKRWIGITARCETPLPMLVDRIVAAAGFGGRGEPPAALAPFVIDQRQKFGEDRVFTFLPTTPPDLPSRRVLLGAIAAVLVGIASMTIWAAQAKRGDDPAMLMCPIIGVGLFVLTMVVVSVARGMRSPSDGIVISPVGLALSRSGLVGLLPWSELREIKFGNASTDQRSLAVSIGSPALRLKVDGAEIPIFNVYDRPLGTIERIIRLYWRGDLYCPFCNTHLPAMGGPLCPQCHADLAQPELLMARAMERAPDAEPGQIRSHDGTIEARAPGSDD